MVQRRMISANQGRQLKKTIYRKCLCGETAHDAIYQIVERRFVWACRNCRSLARTRNGETKCKGGTPPVGHDRGVGGDDPQTDKGG